MDAGPVSARPSWLRRVGWLVLLWTLSVVALGGVAVLIRLSMTAAGMIA
ncbi:MAG: DUF2474 domain-containing protein [Xanthobacteraceae bacterium]|nr:DUF2474 domain-containing protein [Xanthobacteraceae bacterium]